MSSEYERIKQANIEKNKALLAELGLDKPIFAPKMMKRPPPPPKEKKRKLDDEADYDDNTPPNVKVSRIASPPTSVSDSGLRRSSRHANKTVDYKKEIQKKTVPAAYSSGVKESDNAGPLGSQAGMKRVNNPKTYGSIPGIEVGTWWETREGCSVDAIHAPWVGGISGGKQGAHSVVLSGGYDDDVDLGYAFTYTGSGGRDLKGTKAAPKNLRTAPQSCDQTFEHNFNRMLQRSSETKKPVRVVRGFKSKSPFAPYEGYRYDGLYTVEKAWLEKGNNPKGYLVCRYAFKRLPGQPPLPVRDDRTEPGDGAQDEDGEVKNEAREQSDLNTGVEGCEDDKQDVKAVDQEENNLKTEDGDSTEEVTKEDPEENAPKEERED